MDAIKGSHEGALSYGILGLMGRTPIQVEARLIDFFSAKGSMVSPTSPARDSTSRWAEPGWAACSCGRRARAASG